MSETPIIYTARVVISYTQKKNTHIVYRDIDGIGYLLVLGHICSFCVIQSQLLSRRPHL